MDDDSESSGSSSTGRQARKAARIAKLPYEVNPIKIDDFELDDLSIGYLSLQKPSDLREVSTQQDVCLYILDATDHFSLRILREVYHQNILHLEAVISSSPSSIELCVERFTHSLYMEVRIILSQIDIDVADLVQKIKALIRQLIVGVDELRVNGLYHGNLNLASTYFDKNTSLVKLANFKKKDGNDLLKLQFEDWVGVGNMVIEVATLLKSDYPSAEDSIMKNLGKFLENLPSSVTIEQVKSRALNHVFFWNKSRRTSFFIDDILQVIHKPDFVSKVNEISSIPVLWTSDDHAGILTAMTRTYSSGRHQYVKFVSAAYTHEEELKSENKISTSIVVDDIVSQRHPCLCLELVEIARGLGVDV